MLRITIENADAAMRIKLEGRVAGPWAEELGRFWVEKASQLVARKLVIDLTDLTYADANGRSVLKQIYSQTHASFVATTPWTKELALEITVATKNLS
jgi:anti-anti-sigma regulatory factor